MSSNITYSKSSRDYSARKPSNIFTQGHFSSFFVLHFVESKTGELNSTAFCREIDSLQNSIYGYAHEFQNVTSFFHDFCGVEVKSDASRCT